MVMVHDVAELCVGAGTIVGECVDGIFFFFFLNVGTLIFYPGFW